MNELLVIVCCAALVFSIIFFNLTFDKESDGIYRIILGAVSMLLWFSSANMVIAVYPTYSVIGILLYGVSTLFMLFTVYEVWLFADRSRRGASWWSLGKP